MLVLFLACKSTHYLCVICLVRVYLFMHLIEFSRNTYHQLAPKVNTVSGLNAAVNLTGTVGLTIPQMADPEGGPVTIGVQKG